jgi:hypothetical protein
VRDADDGYLPVVYGGGTDMMDVSASKGKGRGGGWWWWIRAVEVW